MGEWEHLRRRVSGKLLDRIRRIHPRKRNNLRGAVEGQCEAWDGSVDAEKWPRHRPKVEQGQIDQVTTFDVSLIF